MATSAPVQAVCVYGDVRAYKGASDAQYSRAVSGGEGIHRCEHVASRVSKLEPATLGRGVCTAVGQQHNCEQAGGSAK